MSIIDKLGITPGPWHMFKGNAKAFWEIYSYGNGKIPLNVVDKVSLFSDRGEIKNAKLIAAAPEMLEALVYFCKRVEEGTIISSKTFSYYKNIIEKATGEKWEKLKEII